MVVEYRKEREQLIETMLSSRDAILQIEETNEESSVDVSMLGGFANHLVGRKDGTQHKGSHNRYLAEKAPPFPAAKSASAKERLMDFLQELASLRQPELPATPRRHKQHTTQPIERSMPLPLPPFVGDIPTNLPPLVSGGVYVPCVVRDAAMPFGVLRPYRICEFPGWGAVHISANEAATRIYGYGHVRISLSSPATPQQPTHLNIRQTSLYHIPLCWPPMMPQAA